MHPLRRACDLCYRKKIKCDRETPRCSPCVVYKSECTYEASSRKTPSRKQAAAQRQHREESLESRIKTLEDQLSTVLEKVDRLEKFSGSGQDVPNLTPQIAKEGDARVTAWTPNIFPQELPPYEDVLPMAERYLATFNSCTPLFHPKTLLQIIENWYQNPQERNPTIWATINVVLALGSYTSCFDDTAQIQNPAIYLNNAQSVLTEVIMGETDLINVQVLLGMAILFWAAAEDLRPVLILVSTALRLAHRLGLHTRTSSECLCPVTALQRNRVFWIAYILDRDISLLSRLAPVQLDGEVDLDLPPSEVEDDLTGFVLTVDGYIKMNYFRARVELARIQGKVYECIYSLSARNASSEEKANNVMRTLRMLDDWSSRIPSEFNPTTLSQVNIPRLSRQFCLLYSTSVSCRALLSFASAWDSFHFSRWVYRVQDYGEQVVAGRTTSHAPTLPQGWKALVGECREYLSLFTTVTPRDPYFIRMTLCAYNSCSICLTANSVISGHNSHVDFDDESTKTDGLFLEDMVENSVWEIRDAITRLGSYANLIARMAFVDKYP